MLFAKVVINSENSNRAEFFSLIGAVAKKALAEGVLEDAREVVSLVNGYELPVTHSYARTSDKFKLNQKEHYLYAPKGFEKSALPSRDDCDSDGEYAFLTKTSWEIISLPKDAGVENIGYFKSGTINRKDLAIPYTYHNKEHLFYPDWLFTILLIVNNV